MRYLHLATHGFFARSELNSALYHPVNMPDALSPPLLLSLPGTRTGFQDSLVGFHPGLLSGLALAGANRNSEPATATERARLDDGILTALEVAELNLSGTELVVLSACETGLGRAAGGEGLLGLQRLPGCGARTVVASLWKVDDEATRELMAEFYANLWRKHLGPMEALRQAQLLLLNGGCTSGRARGIGAPEPGPVEEHHAGSPEVLGRMGSQRRPGTAITDMSPMSGGGRPDELRSRDTRRLSVRNDLPGGDLSCAR